MSGRRDRPVMYRRAVWLWLTVFGLAVTLTVVAVPAGGRQVVAFTAAGLGAAAAVALWARSNHRTGRPPRPTRPAGVFEPSSWRQAVILVLNIAVTNLVGAGGPVLAWGAALTATVTLTLPLQLSGPARERPAPSNGGPTTEDQPVEQKRRTNDRWMDAMTDPKPGWRPEPVAAGRRWQPWWAGDLARVRWTLVMSAVWTGLALLNLRGGDRITVINWGLLAILGWLTGLTGLLLLRRRPDLAALPRRPNTPTATGCILTAAVTGVVGVAALEISVPDHTAAGLAWFVAGLAATAGLGFVAYRSNNFAETTGRFIASTLDHGAQPQG